MAWSEFFSGKIIKPAILDLVCIKYYLDIYNVYKNVYELN